MRRIIVGISGASGVIYGVRMLEVLRGVADIETHVVVSPAARRMLVSETDSAVSRVRLKGQKGADERLGQQNERRLTSWRKK